MSAVFRLGIIAFLTVGSRTQEGAPKTVSPEGDMA